jgi:hypothetical protein
MNFSKVLKGLKQASEALNALDEAGVDVDRLIGISNSQGPQGKVIKNILTAVSGLESSGHSGSMPSKTQPIKVKKKAKGQKALPPRT